MGYNKSLSDVYSETWTRYKNQCETDGYIALNRFCAGTGVNVQRLYEWLRRRKISIISISDYQRSLPERPDSSREGGEPLFREVKVPVFRLRMRAGMSVPPISCVTCTSNSVGVEA